MRASRSISARRSCWRYGPRDRSAEQVAHAVEVCLAELNAQHAHTAAVIANRCDPTQLTAIVDALRKFAPKAYAVPDEPLLVAPTVADLENAVDWDTAQR